MMAKGTVPAPRFRFGDYVLDGESRELKCNGQPVDIEPRAFEFLSLLASRPQHTFTKDEIIEALWPGRIVSDSVIAQCVRKARQATGDTASLQAVIKTMHGVGYRFNAPLLAEPTRPSSVSAQGALRVGRPILWLASGMLLLAALLWLPG
jgi:DNA-binding winged helix-turn-helix (wHTH) protein